MSPKIFRRLLEIFDMFAVKPSDILTFKDEFYYSTYLTKTITLVFAVLAVVYSIIQILDVVGLDNPKINFYETYTVDTDPLNFGDEGFFIAFSMQNATSNEYFNPEMYEPRLEALNKTTSYKNITLVNCYNESQNISDNFKNILSDSLSFFYCLQNYNDLVLEGTWDSKIFLNYQLTIRPNQTLTYDAANKFIEESVFIMKYTTTQLNLDDANDPLTMIPGDYFLPTDSNSLINIFFGIAPVFFQNQRSSDVDLQVPIYTKKGIVNAWEKYSAKSRQTNSTDDFFSINLRMAQIEKQYIRTYAGFSAAFSNIGGMFNFVSILFNLCLLNFLRNALIQRISNEVFDYHEYIDMFDKDESPNSNKMGESKRKIKWSFIEDIKNCLPCFFDKKRRSIFKVRKEIIESARTQMKKHYDIANLMNRINECQKIQYVLSSEQFKKFNEISKPKLCLKRSDSKEFKDERQQKFYNYYNTHYIQNKGIPSEMIKLGPIQKIVKPKSFSNSRTIRTDSSYVEMSKLSKFAQSSLTQKEFIKENYDRKQIFQKNLNKNQPHEILGIFSEEKKNEKKNIERFEERKSLTDPGYEDMLEEKHLNFEHNANRPKLTFLTLENIAEETIHKYADESNRSAMGMVQAKKKINDFTVEPVSFYDQNI